MIVLSEVLTILMYIILFKQQNYQSNGNNKCVAHGIKLYTHIIVLHIEMFRPLFSLFNLCPINILHP